VAWYFQPPLEQANKHLTPAMPAEDHRQRLPVKLNFFQVIKPDRGECGERGDLASGGWMPDRVIPAASRYQDTTASDIQGVEDPPNIHPVNSADDRQLKNEKIKSTAAKAMAASTQSHAIATRPRPTAAAASLVLAFCAQANAPRPIAAVPSPAMITR